MIRRYVSTDIPTLLDFLRPSPDLYAQLSVGLNSIDTLYFDVWLARTDGRITCVIFRNYGDYYICATERADLAELLSFLQFSPVIGTLSCALQLMNKIKDQLPPIAVLQEGAVAVQPESPRPLPFELSVTKAASMGDYVGIYNLLREVGIMEIKRVDDYYYIRKNMERSWMGRTYCLQHNGVTYATSSTSGEGGDVALITDVATHPAFRRQGLGRSLITELCRDLHAAGKTPFVSYHTEQAARFYRELGFIELYPIARAVLQSTGS